MTNKVSATQNFTVLQQAETKFDICINEVQRRAIHAALQQFDVKAYLQSVGIAEQTEEYDDVAYLEEMLNDIVIGTDGIDIPEIKEGDNGYYDFCEML